MTTAREEHRNRTLAWTREDNGDARDKIRQNSDLMDNVTRELAWCCRDVIVHRPVDGADLPEILIAYRMQTIFNDVGLAVVPMVPTSKMRSAWKRGLFRCFHDRFRAMVEAP